MSPNSDAKKAVVVIDAVTIPPSPTGSVPDAELRTRFVVGPSEDGKASDTSATQVQEQTPPATASSRQGNSLHINEERSPGAEAASSPSSARTGRDSSSGANTKLNDGAGNSAHAAGISISGGVPARDGQSGHRAETPHPITIIGAGNNGGASRDLGVFERTDAVYTIYLPMSDVGGGLDWPLQYALMGRVSMDPRGLLIPPAALKKVPAVAPRLESGAFADPGPVFLAGIIDDNGNLKLLRAVRVMDARAQAAIDAVSQWEFLPAQLDGIAVATKVLIGVRFVQQRVE